MGRKSVKKLTNRVKKFSTLDHFGADLDGLCLGITDVNDTFRLLANAYWLLKPANLYFSINTPFLSFTAGKNFYLSVCLDLLHRYLLLVTKQDL